MSERVEFGVFADRDQWVVSVKNRIFYEEDGSKALMAAGELAETLNAREETIEQLAQWKKTAIAIFAEWSEAWVAAGQPGGIGESMPEATTKEIERLKAENAELKKKLGLQEEAALADKEPG